MVAELTPLCDLAEVRGQEAAKRALEVAAAGRHSLLLVGPAGTGKTLLARCLPGLLPPLGADEAEAVGEAYRGAELKPPPARPVRTPGAELAPRQVALELTLAAHGTLVLDDLPALRPATLAALARALGRSGPPVQVVATMRLCPCGQAGDPDRACVCPGAGVRRHRARVAACVDRFDITLAVPPVTLGELRGRVGCSSTRVRVRVKAARKIQQRRGGLSAMIGAPELVLWSRLTGPGRILFGGASQRLALGAATRDRVLRVARTLADLAGVERADAPHVAEAVQYRSEVEAMLRSAAPGG